MTSSECYDPKTKRWTKLPQIPVTTHGASAVAIGVSIYILGGASMPWPSALDFIQVFDTVAREWSVLRTVRPQHRLKPRERLYSAVHRVPSRLRLHCAGTAGAQLLRARLRLEDHLPRRD